MAIWRVSIRHMASTAVEALPLKNDLRLSQRVQEGIPVDALLDLAERLGLDRGILADVVRIPRRTLDRRVSKGKALAFDEGERTVRLIRLFERAVEVFANEKEAVAWFNEESALLGGATPLRLCSTEAGARAVEQLLGRLEHGIFS